ncbi:MAG TPA: lysylphosphatidylglycerol synthase transmembrane domain-containing protein [Nocardioides sp.]|uniref:lysylphosphatidylglycerol synthase transmembrane domain-containing protein n=1 Tax=Nocardioides sp. TaxID=35761 RepID=UPI002EDB088F
MPSHHTLRGRLFHWGRILLVLAVVAAAVWTVQNHWAEVRGTIVEMSWRDWVPAFLVLPVAIGLSTMSWQLLVDELGEPIGVSRGAQIFLVGQLGKYLPGSVWAYVLQMELGRRAGLARARVFTATLFSLAVAVVAALVCGVLAIPSLSANDEALEPLRWLYLLLPIGLVCLHPRILDRLVELAFRILRRPPLDHPVRGRAVLLSLLAAIGSYVAFGLHLWLLAHGSSGEASIGLLRLCVGAMAAAMISGLFFFVLPSGAGVRELVIVTALTPYVGTGPAIALAAVSRVLLTVADLVTASVSATLGVIERRRHGPIHHDPGIGDDEV